MGEGTRGGDLMHVAHFHPPRAVGITFIAAALAIGITLAIATSLNHTQAGSSRSSGRGAVSRLVPTPPWTTGSTVKRGGAGPAWVASPFSPLLARPITTPWSVRGGG